MKQFIFIGLSICLSACGSQNANQPKSKSDPVNKLQSPKINLDSIRNDQCINLEKWSKAINRKEFNFPARVFTNDLKGEKLHPRFLAYSFGITEMQLKIFPRFSQISQPSCEKVIIKNSYGRDIVYTITEASDRSLTIEKVDQESQAESEEEEEEEISEAVLEAQRDEILASRIQFEWLSPTSLKLKEATATFQPLCDAFKKIPYEKTITVQWAQARNSLSGEYDIQKTYHDQISSLLKGPEMPDPPDLPDLDSLPRHEVADEEVTTSEGSEEEVPIDQIRVITVDQVNEIKDKLMAQNFTKECQ